MTKEEMEDAIREIIHDKCVSTNWEDIHGDLQMNETEIENAIEAISELVEKEKEEINAQWRKVFGLFRVGPFIMGLQNVLMARHVLPE